MSFSKAKIQRFNDVKICTPSPAKYTVVTQEKIKLGIICKPTNSVKKTGSPKSSEAGSVHSTPCFQTPTVPLKRKKILGMSFKSSKTPGKLTDKEELRDKIVECNNKDLYIQDLTEQIEDITEKLNCINKENVCLKNDNGEYIDALVALKKQSEEERIYYTKEYNKMGENVRVINQQLKEIKHKQAELTNENLVDLSKLLSYISKFEELHNKTIEESQEELKAKNKEIEKIYQQNEKLLQNLKLEHNKQIEELREIQVTKCRQYQQDIETLKVKHSQEKEELLVKLKEHEAKILLLEENLKDVNVLTELQMKEKFDEIENIWKQKLDEKEKESVAILKECQEISEYNIIQSEVEKNQIKNTLEEKRQFCEELLLKIEGLKEELMNLKNEKHAYELSITTFKDTIEVLKKRLINSDRDVEQLKEELDKSEEKILNYERKCTELNNQLLELQVANDELEMQYESTSKLMENQIKSVEADLLIKVELLQKTAQADRDLLKETLQQNQEQQILISEAETTIAQSSCALEALEQQQSELESELNLLKLKFKQETEEAAEIRKKYIEKSGKYDELAQQFEQLLQELDQSKDKIENLERLIGPYQQQLEEYHNELKLLNTEKTTVENEFKELGLKYAHILGHQNHQQKIKYVHDLRIKSSELFQKNMDLEMKNQKLNKVVEKLMKEIDDLRKPGKKLKMGMEDKENIGSPKCLKGTQSPGPLKDKN